MRISTRREDPGFSDVSYLYEVRLNGAKLRRCHTADEERGEAVCHVEDPTTGEIALDPATGEPREETVRGDVRIIRASAEPQPDYPGLAEHEKRIEALKEAGIPAYYEYRDVQWRRPE